MPLNLKLVDDILQAALREDIGTGDITTFSTVPPSAEAFGLIYAKEEGIIAGIPVAKRTFELLSTDIKFKALKKDGDRVKVKDVVAEINGSAMGILMGERTALNIMQRMSGIATQTARIAGLLAPYKTKVIDTRKTTPGLRILEKYAVKTGGGHNHRFGLYDGILIKDNHIKVSGGITKAVISARQNAPHTLKIEVE
ncbi:MAG TPA: carboxylating nicotinate-nucleotide diphosphorylase, partial [Desulfobacteria bacterium]|nr:carboxylating nicotinate-nucleotide diphosphorylase [Desulfobacteria bacterium]